MIDRAGGHVLLEKDVSETDKYGRLLCYVWLVHPDGQRMLNEELVKGGYAQVSTYPPDVKYQDLFLSSRAAGEKERRRFVGNLRTFGVPAVSQQPKAPPAESGTSITSPASGGASLTSAGDKDCKDFATHGQAQAYFEGRWLAQQQRRPAG